MVRREMKRLRKHPRVDTLGTQQRAGSVRWGRLIYLSLVTAFAGSIAYYVAGNTVVLSADGIVLKDRYAVDASYPAKVIEVFVKEGDRVETGTPLLRLESFDMVKELADMAYRDGELAIREGQLRGTPWRDQDDHAAGRAHGSRKHQGRLHASTPCQPKD